MKPKNAWLPMFPFVLCCAWSAHAQNYSVNPGDHHIDADGHFALTTHTLWDGYGPITDTWGTIYAEYNAPGSAPTTRSYAISSGSGTKSFSNLSAGTYRFNEIETCYEYLSQHVSCSTSPLNTTVEVTTFQSPAVYTFDVGDWRLASRNDRKTLGTATSSSSTLTRSSFSGEDRQHWRFTPTSSANQYYIAHQGSGDCLRSTGSLTTLGACDAQAVWEINTLRQRTEDRPAIYHIQSTSHQTCLSSIGSGAPSLASCDNNTRWYIEPVGWGDPARQQAREYIVNGLLLVKPETDSSSPATSGTLSSANVSAVKYAFENNVNLWWERITDGRVSFAASAVESAPPIATLSLEGGNYLPAASHLQDDVRTHVPRGVYDTVQVYFTPGDSVTGGWGWGPGKNYFSNYSLWTTINGKYQSASQWYSSNTNSEPLEVFIHEPTHGYDSYAQSLGIPLPSGLLHGTGNNEYSVNSNSNTSWLHWLRDYWLGTVIAADDTYRGYGPKLFRRLKPKDWAHTSAAASDADEYKIVHYGGKCVTTNDGSATPAMNSPTVLSDSCDDRASSFRLLSNGLIKHLPSQYCIHPLNGTAAQGVKLALFPSCNEEERLKFSMTSGGSLMHQESGLCVHPSGGSANPSEGTSLVFWSGCDEPRLQFAFDYVE